MRNFYNKESETRIAEIERGESLFKYIPDNIGELKYCISTNYKAVADSGKKRAKQYAIGLGIFITIPILSCLIFNESPIWNTILIIGCLFGIYKTIKNVSSFKGTDYFVGNKGFCSLEFDGTRDNIIKKKTILFDDVTDLLTKQVHVKQNGSYSHTDYFIIFISSQDKTIKLSDGGSYDKDHPDELRIFYDKVIDSWKEYKNKDLARIPMSFNAYVIKNDSIEHALIPYIEVADDSITVHGLEYQYSDIKQMKFESQGGGLCLLIEHNNHVIEKKSFWRKKESGNVEHIPLDAMGNQEFFVTYFQWLISTKGLYHENLNS